MAAANMFTSTKSARVMNGRMLNSFLNPHVLSIEKKLKELGVNPAKLSLSESRFLALVVRPDEKILGILDGRYQLSRPIQAGRGVLIATAERLLLIDKKPPNFSYYELGYSSVNSVLYRKIGPAGTVILQTDHEVLSIRTLNHLSGLMFVNGLSLRLTKRAKEQLDWLFA